jgi:hypothetical protein
MSTQPITITSNSDSVTIDISKDYFGGGFPWFRTAICFAILTGVYFVALPHLLSAVPPLRELPHIQVIKHLAILPILIVFFLLHFMGFHIRTDDGTSYFLSLAFYSPRIIATPRDITIVRRWFLRKQTTRIPVPELQEFKTSPWFQFVSSRRTVTISDGLKGADGKRIRDAINTMIKTEER